MTPIAACGTLSFHVLFSQQASPAFVMAVQYQFDLSGACTGGAVHKQNSVC
jgi:hypothetical protein